MLKTVLFEPEKRRTVAPEVTLHMRMSLSAEPVNTYCSFGWMDKAWKHGQKIKNLSQNI
jgi:hypothetical protein